MNVHEMKAEHTRLLSELTSVTDTAKRESRELTTDESHTVAAGLKRLDDLSAAIKSGAADTTTRKVAEGAAFRSDLEAALARAGGTSKNGPRATYFAHHATELAQTAAKAMLGDRDGTFKALAPSGGLDARTGNSPVFELGRRRRWIADLVLGNPYQINAGEFSYLRQVVRTLNAATVAPGAPKPRSTVSVEQQTAILRTVAHLSEPIERHLLEDHVQLEKFVRDEMVFGVALKVDDQILNGDGSAPDLDGVLGVDGTQDQPFSVDAFRTLRKARTRLENIGKELDDLTVVMNPADVEELDLAVGEDEHFINSDDATTDGIARIWGVKILPSPTIEPGLAIMADWSGAELKARTNGVQIVWTEHGTAPYGVEPEDTDLFSHNLIQVHAEVRVGLAVERPDWFVIVDLGAGLDS